MSSSYRIAVLAGEAAAELDAKMNLWLEFRRKYGPDAAQLADIASGMYAYSGVLSALIQRGRTGVEFAAARDIRWRISIRRHGRLCGRFVVVPGAGARKQPRWCAAD